MQIQVKCSCGEEKCPEWAIVELQGVVEVQPSFQGTVQNLEIGQLCRPSSQELGKGWWVWVGSGTNIHTVWNGGFQFSFGFCVQENYTFTVGYHELSGSKVPLKKPFVVLKKTRHLDANQNGDSKSSSVDLEVVGIIRHRILFKSRPKALISTPTVVLSMDGFESTFCESIHFLMSLKMLGSSTGKGSMTDKDLARGEPGMESFSPSPPDSLGSMVGSRPLDAEGALGVI
ncbi:hypothetical protein CK203_057790 [Vitis vinifera]|uniref:Uncharacterized protein n=1 Tax=Vitis vinifera TaxID=29760 RepID=A0A438GLU1_VITVI|nr:hypothetical protein CK203_057790 [Vitis vinifera]